MPDKDGGAPFLQRQLDDFNGTVHTGAKSTRCGQIQGQWGLVMFHPPQVARHSPFVQHPRGHICYASARNRQQPRHIHMRFQMVGQIIKRLIDARLVSGL